MPNQLIFLCGVSGCGKTTIGHALGRALDWPFFDGDDFHPESNIAKMRSGQPLTDQDRHGWLENIRQFALEKLQSGSLIVACSALKEQYRQQLMLGCAEQCRWVYLHGSFDLVAKRLSARTGHFMPANLLQSQFDALEVPHYGHQVSIALPIEQIVSSIQQYIDNMNEFGLIGLGVMGKSLSRNLADKGFRLALFNRFMAGQEEQVALKFIEQYHLNAQGFENLQAFVRSLARPRKVFLMVNAGAATDELLHQLLPLLEAGDIVIDGGNAHFSDTERRATAMAEKGIWLLGTGVSGGEAGALKGPAIMPGGAEAAYQQVAPFLEAIAAKDASGRPCCHFIGKGGAGHFVKMVHNGIEYAEMQLLAEVYGLLRSVNGWPPEQIAATLEAWNQTELSSYLLQITADILRHTENGALLLDQILDEAGNKGTGSWTSIAACELGVPVPTLVAALFARYTSAMKKERVEAAALYTPAAQSALVQPDILKSAYQLARIVNHHQGFHLIKEASRQYGWDIDLAALARVWTNGCIIRSALMEQMAELLAIDQPLLQHPIMVAEDQKNRAALSQLVGITAASAEPIPCLESTLTYLKAYTQANASANLIQAQRDYFGAHTYRLKTDPEGVRRHTEWGGLPK